MVCGGIIKFDEEDREYHISSMIVLGNHSDGPKRSTEGDILCSLDNPVKLRKTRNMFNFSAKDLKKVQYMFD